MEITIISAQGLKKASTLSSILFSHRHLRPFITLTTTTTTPPPSSSAAVYTTTVDHEGGVNPTWGDKFDLSNVIDASFFHHKYSCIYLRLYTDRVFFRGPRFLGWCGIPARDIADGFTAAGTARQLSYRLRKKDGSRTHGVVNVVVKLDGSVFQGRQRVDSGGRRVAEVGFGGVAIGIPVKMVGGRGGDKGSSL